MQLQQGKQFAKSSLLRKCGLLAHTSAAFLKNCWSKKLFVCLRLVIENTVLRKTTWIRFGKAEAHPQLALGIAIAPETLYLVATFQFLRQLRFFRFSFRFLLRFIVQFLFASQMWAARPHLGSNFWKTAAPKNFLVACGSLLTVTSIISKTLAIAIPTVPALLHKRNPAAVFSVEQPALSANSYPSKCGLQPLPPLQDLSCPAKFRYLPVYPARHMLDMPESAHQNTSPLPTARRSPRARSYIGTSPQHDNMPEYPETEYVR